MINLSNVGKLAGSLKKSVVNSADTAISQTKRTYPVIKSSYAKGKETLTQKLGQIRTNARTLVNEFRDGYNDEMTRKSQEG